MRLAPLIIISFFLLITALLYSLFFSDSGISERNLIIESNKELLEENQRLMDENKKLSESIKNCLLYTSPSPRDRTRSRMPSSA